MTAPVFRAWLDDFFTSYFRHRPVNATFIGMHEYDHVLPDFSESGMAATLGDTSRLLLTLAALPAETLSPSEEIDRQLAEGFLLIQRWESGSAHFGWSNPSLFTGEAIFGVVSLLLRPFASLEDRLHSAAARLAAIPDFLDSEMRQAQSAPAAWRDRAHRESSGAQLLLEDVGVHYPGLHGVADAAAMAFARFDAFLKTDLKLTDEYACGPEAFSLLLSHAHFLEMDADNLERLALERIAEEEAALSSAAPSATTPETGDYLSRCTELWNDVRDLVTKYDVLTFPDWPVHFVEQPAWAKRAAPYLYFLPYRSPAPLDNAPTVDYLVPPGADDSTIKLNHVVHHGSLGHHVQNWFAARAPSRIGRIAATDCASRIAMLCGGTLAEGWACYATDLADEFGFLTPSESYAQHRARLRLAARAIVDIRLHDRRFSLADATQFYTERVGMTPAASHAEAVKNTLFPATACMYLAGWDAIWRLRRRAHALPLRDFHDRLLSFGSVPVSLVARYMFNTGGPTDVLDASSRLPASGGSIRQHHRAGSVSVEPASGAHDRGTGG
jgi:uncharacterized protein (DUF885 family)